MTSNDKVISEMDDDEALEAAAEQMRRLGKLVMYDRGLGREYDGIADTPGYKLADRLEEMADE